MLVSRGVIRLFRDKRRQIDSLCGLKGRGEGSEGGEPGSRALREGLVCEGRRRGAGREGVTASAG